MGRTDEDGGVVQKFFLVLAQRKIMAASGRVVGQGPGRAVAVEFVTGFQFFEDAHFFRDACCVRERRRGEGKEGGRERRREGGKEGRRRRRRRRRERRKYLQGAKSEKKREGGEGEEGRTRNKNTEGIRSARSIRSRHNN
jgi:hypothetical protein